MGTNASSWRASAARMSPGARLRGHGHARAHLCWVRAGGFSQRTEAGLRTCGPGTLRFSPAHARHELSFHDEGATCVLVELEGPRFTHLATSALFRREPALEALAERLIGLPSTLAGELVGRRLLDELEARAALDEPEDEPEWLREARRRLSLEPTESLAALARSLGVHRAHLAREHRRFYGRSLRAELGLRRILRAVELLRDPRARLDEVALGAGYYDQSHMTHAFRAELGTSPGRLRGSGAR